MTAHARDLDCGTGVPPVLSAGEFTWLSVCRVNSYGRGARATGMALLVLAMVLTLSGLALGQEPPEGKVVHFTVHPAAPPVPAMKYRLLPAMLDLTPGNAVPLYLIAADLPRVLQRPEEWTAAPLEEFPHEEVAAFLDGMSEVRHQLALAARRERAIWEVPYREEGWAVRLPYLNSMSFYALIIAVEARAQMIDGDFDAAIHTLQTGFAMAKHLSEDSPVLVQGLLAASRVRVLTERVEELVQQPGAPNLYWALAHLPRPFVDVRSSVERDMATFYHHFPQLRDARPGSLTAQEWFEVWLRVHALLQQMEIPGLEDDLSQIAEDEHPDSRERLVARGIDRGRVGAMPPEEAVGLDFLYTYRDVNDAVYKWLGVPPWQARSGLDRAKDFRDSAHKEQPQNALLALVVSVERAYMHVAQLDRRIAMLQCVEAIRAYAAANEGRVPARLEDLVDTPAPFDPMTGRAFEYRVEDGRAIIDAREPPKGEPWWAVRYVITIAP